MGEPGGGVVTAESSSQRKTVHWKDDVADKDPKQRRNIYRSRRRELAKIADGFELFGLSGDKSAFARDTLMQDAPMPGSEEPNVEQAAGPSAEPVSIIPVAPAGAPRELNKEELAKNAEDQAKKAKESKKVKESLKAEDLANKAEALAKMTKERAKKADVEAKKAKNALKTAKDQAKVAEDEAKTARYKATARYLDVMAFIEGVDLTGDATASAPDAHATELARQHDVGLVWRLAWFGVLFRLQRKLRES